MTSAKTTMFLRERDRARIRQDWGVDRSLTADLRRLGVPDDATLACPRGQPRQRSKPPEEPLESPESIDPKKGGRPKLPRCEHGQVADRCVECNDE